MGKVKIFTTSRCPKCPQAKVMGERLQRLGVHVEYYDLETADGLAEAAFYSVQSTPTILVEEEEEVVARWAGQVPSEGELQRVVFGCR